MPSSMIPTLSKLEVITVRIDVGQITTVCTVYVPPSACYNYQVSLLTYLNNIVSTSECVLIVSDLIFWISPGLPSLVPLLSQIPCVNLYLT